MHIYWTIPVNSGCPTSKAVTIQFTEVVCNQGFGLALRPVAADTLWDSYHPQTECLFIITVSWVPKLERKADIISVLFTHKFAVLIHDDHWLEFGISLILKTCTHILYLKSFELDRAVWYVTVFSFCKSLMHSYIHDYFRSIHLLKIFRMCMIII